jgi:hypothetical protein
MAKTAKFTVSLTAAEFKELEAARKALGLSRSQFIRDSFRCAKATFPRAGEVKEEIASAEKRLKRAIAAAGRFRSGGTDLSKRHDDYLAEAYAAVYPGKDDPRKRRRS